MCVGVYIKVVVLCFLFFYRKILYIKSNKKIYFVIFMVKYIFINIV